MAQSYRATLVKEVVDKDKLKEVIDRVFNKHHELGNNLKEIVEKHGNNWQQKLKDIIDRYLKPKEETAEKRSLKDMWEKVKNYFDELGIQIKEKYAKFGEWAKEHLEKGKEVGKDKVANLRNIAKEFIDHTKGVSKDVAAEALEFLRPYKEDLGDLWDKFKDAAKDIISRKD